MTSTISEAPRARAALAPEATIVVPTYDEAANAPALLTRIDRALRGRCIEVLFVDDGTDNLPDVIARLSATLPFPARVIRRAHGAGGLSGAVVDGIRQARGDLVVVCDGDLQHPPETIPLLLEAAAVGEIVVASRYVAGGNAGGLSTGARRLTSRACALLSRAAFPVRTRGCSDPMSGFFAVHRAAVPVELLRPRGFKILLEILARSERLTVREVPFRFAPRTAGASHASLGQGVAFLTQLLRLRVAVSGMATRAVLFTLVGASGVIPNVVAMWVMTRLGVGYVIAAIVATHVAILWNFIGCDLLVWHSRRGESALHSRFLRFAAIGETDLVRLPFVILLVEKFAMGSVLATIVTIAAAFLARFALADRWVYRARTRRAPKQRHALATTKERSMP